MPRALPGSDETVSAGGSSSALSSALAASGLARCGISRSRPDDENFRAAMAGVTASQRNNNLTAAIEWVASRWRRVQWPLARRRHLLGQRLFGPARPACRRPRLFFASSSGTNQCTSDGFSVRADGRADTRHRARTVVVVRRSHNNNCASQRPGAVCDTPGPLKQQHLR